MPVHRSAEWVSAILRTRRVLDYTGTNVALKERGDSWLLRRTLRRNDAATPWAAPQRTPTMWRMTLSILRESL
jgi:hypothetical protein